MKAWFATLVYAIVLVFIAGCAGIIVFKLLFTPPCTPTGPYGSLCVVDGWSIAGLAGTTLAVAATVVAFIGAAAIAYWWIKIDQRVDAQVRTLYENQKAIVIEEMNNLIRPLKEEINRTNSLQEHNIRNLELRLSNLRKQIDQVEDEADTIIELTITVAAVNPPWKLERWATDVTNRFKTAEVAAQMVLSYIIIVDEMMQLPLNALLKYEDDIVEEGAPDGRLSYFWKKAQQWAAIVEDHYKGTQVAVFDQDGKLLGTEVPKPLKLVRKKINEYTPKIEQWKIDHPKVGGF